MDSPLDWEHEIGSGGNCWSFNKTVVSVPVGIAQLCRDFPTFRNNSLFFAAALLKTKKQTKLLRCRYADQRDAT